MARPLRTQWRMRTVVRRRHRTWVAAMTCATVGWGVWWLTVVLNRFAPEWTPSLTVTHTVAGAFALVGFLLAVFTIRARLIWVLLAGVPMFANGSLLLLPLVIDGTSEVPAGEE